jgi:hypothetical protein
MSSSKNKKLLIIESSSSPAISSTSSNTNPCTENLEKSYEESKCQENRDTQECNTFLLKKEFVERNCLKQEEEQNNSLYPNLNDEQFNIKIAEKKEFHDTQYDGTMYKNINERADILSKASFELQPHQAFVKNFLSSQTPYNSLLLFHGLGSGKTCSAIATISRGFE